MPSQRSQLYYTCVFLHVSFQAIRNAVTRSPAGDETPCWLDAHTLKLLCRELQRCRWEASPFKHIEASLDTAIYHCGLLMAQCPGALNRRLCQHHLEAIMAPLQEAMLQLSGKRGQASASRITSPRQRLLSWLGW
ncbi:MAG: hypothetical protein LPK20_00980 [Halomonas sp.]|uniref:Uncharacterized protein n=1 Tax=Billgrantia tianxiuensis TaxID=2497861 RepID=A0A6I6SJJ5_9GAMM|nr:MULTISPECIES: hypothetical protein [Halomonas]MCE8032330.1 hypothetical protein [Halomonas sp. MCCC 1A11057]MDX5432128.1 hypothetical protein [Halomonas sp.]QHC49682.1 hypothetical protein EKK97_08770 [Halomonas tianxiuensis]